MEPFNNNNKKTEKERKNGIPLKNDEISPRIKSLSFYDLNNFIKNLSHPRFLGSFHMNKETMSPYNSAVENMVKGQLNLKMNKALKNSFLNPITIVLIIMAIIFNALWIMSMYL